ncbi:MAG: TetR/AcrR family transcriptional regulator [Ferruginibacter sp.]
MKSSKKIHTSEEMILAAARKVFIQKGMDGARMQDIADEAGINKALLHYYFTNKEMLFEKVFKEAASMLFEKMNSILDMEGSLFEKIRHFTDAYLSIVIENPYIPVFVIGEMNRHPEIFMTKVMKIHPPQLIKLVAQIEQEVKAGIIHPISPVQLIINLVSMTVFPFLGKPVIMQLMNVDELQYRLILEQRKTVIADFIIAAIKK